MVAPASEAKSSDVELVIRARDGNDRAYNELVERHLQSVYTFCLRYTGSKEDAQDAVQETFVKAWRNLNRFDLKKSFRTWLFAIAKNAATDLLRKRRSLPISRFDTADDSNPILDTLVDTELLPDELFERSSLVTEIQEALSSLSPRDRAVLSLRYEEEESFEDISRILKIPANTIRSIHRRALILLREILATKLP